MEIFEKEDQIIDLNNDTSFITKKDEDTKFIQEICESSPVEIDGNLFLINYLDKKNIDYEILKPLSQKVVYINDELKKSLNSDKIFILLRSNPDFINDGHLPSDVDLILIYRGQTIFIEYISYEYHLQKCLLDKYGGPLKKLLEKYGCPLVDEDLLKEEKIVFEKDNRKINKVQCEGFKIFHINGRETRRVDLLECMFRKFIKCLGINDA